MERGVKEIKSNRITFRMTPSEVDKLNSISIFLDKTISDMVRDALKKEYEL